VQLITVSSSYSLSHVHRQLITSFNKSPSRVQVLSTTFAAQTFLHVSCPSISRSYVKLFKADVKPVKASLLVKVISRDIWRSW